MYDVFVLVVVLVVFCFFNVMFLCFCYVYLAVQDLLLKFVLTWLLILQEKRILRKLIINYQLLQG